MHLLIELYRLYNHAYQIRHQPGKVANPTRDPLVDPGNVFVFFPVFLFMSENQRTLDPMLLPSRNPIESHEEILSLQPTMFTSKRFDNCSPCLGDAQKV